MKLRSTHPLVWVVLLAFLFGSGFFLFFHRASAKFSNEQNPPNPGPVEFSPGELLIRFNPSISPGRSDEVLAAHGVGRLRKISPLNIDVLRLPPNMPVEQAVEVFSHLPEVEFAEPNYILHITQGSTSWQDNQWAPQRIQAPEVWAQIANPAPVTIAIVDTGVDYRHSQLGPNMWANAAEQNGTAGVDDDHNGYIDDIYGWDFYNNDSDPMGDHFHGTHVAGIAAATTGTGPTGMSGICPFCRIMAVKAMGADGSGSLDTVARGITYAADNGARVINLSLGGSVGTATLQNAVDYAWGKGALVVAAAGNDGAATKLYPAAYTNAMAAASTNSNDYHSCFSNYGTSTSIYVSVSAPGESIYSTTLVDASGADTYGTYSGTSMATPHVSGLAGLLFAQNPNHTNTEVRSLIQATTEDLGPAGLDPYFGTGRINAYRAISNIQDPTTPQDGLFSYGQTATGYANARKLARDLNGTLHLVWHTQDGALYRVRYATSNDGGNSWSIQPDVFSSTSETYHPAVAIDNSNLYVAFPSKADSSSGKYRIYFSHKSLSRGGWSQPVLLTDGAYDAVRPDLYVDPSNGRLHVVASSLDNAQYVYYTASSDQGLSWLPVRSVNPSTPLTGSNTRYATIHVNGQNIYIAAKTVATSWFMTNYYLHTVRSTDGGGTWFDQTKISTWQAFTTGEYGLSLAGIGDRLYMAYEVGGGIYFRRYDGTGWSDYLQLESSGAWPSINQAPDGQAWMVWENAGSILLRHYTGTSWEPAQTLLSANAFNKGYYPNLKLGIRDGWLEWLYTSCCGAPFRLIYSGLNVGNVPSPTPTATHIPSSTPTSTSTDTPTPTPTNTNTPTPTSTQTPTNTPTQTPTATSTNTPTPTATNTPTSTPTRTPTPTPTTPSDTGFISPSANLKGSTGDKNGYEVNPSNAYSDDGLFAIDYNSGTNTSSSCTSTAKDSHSFFGYTFAIPPGKSVQGIEIRLDAKIDSTSGSPKICVQLSGDGGATWSGARPISIQSTSEDTYGSGGPADVWGKTWTAGNFSKFRVRIIDVASSKDRDFYLDWIAVKLYLK